MQIIVDGMLTHYERTGDIKSPTVLVLPGWADTSRSWLKVQQTLSSKFDVIVLDIPGFGGSQMPDQSWGLDKYAAFIGSFLRKLEITEPYGLVGHSNGGAMAIRAVAQGIIKPKKLVLLASAGIRGEQTGRKLGLKIVAKAGKVVTMPLPKSVRTNLRARLYQAAGSDLLVAEHMQETFKQVVADDVQADAAKITVPSLLIYGDADTETPLKYGQMYEKLIKGSKLVAITDAGHFIHTENATEVAQYIEDFLR